MASEYIDLPARGAPNWTTSVANAAALPATGNNNGDVRVTLDTGDIWEWNGTAWQNNTGGGGGGTVTSVSVVSANGLAGTVANPTTTPAITLSTTITGVLQGNGTAISAATVGNLTDAGTDGITITGGTAAVLGYGTSISQHVADTSHNGYLSSTDWNTFNNKQPAGNYITALTGDGTATGPGSAALTLATVNSNVGSFSPAAITVNGKGLITAASNVATGNLTEATSAVLTITGGTGSVIGSGTSIQVTQSSTSQSGYLSSTDWNTFNNKQAAGNYITGLTGDVTASGPGSVAATLATVNSNVGSFTNASITVNGKGLITAASSGTAGITEAQVWARVAYGM